MTPVTFSLGIVVALLAGVLVAVLFLRSEPKEEPSAVEETLARLETQIRDMEAQRLKEQGGLQQHLTALNKETVTLSQALRTPNARGRWGELTLKRVAELAGMAAYCDFHEQLSGGGMRPDMVVRLPGNRTLAVDAKVPLAAYLDAEAASNEADRKAALDRHAQHLKRHILHLSAREYWTSLQPAPEMVVLFLAGEHFLSAALEREPELLEKAIEKKVMLATPVTLVSVLKGVAYGWRQERLAKNAEELRKIAGEFHERAQAFAEVYGDAGKHLAKAVDAYNRSVGSWESRLEPSLRRVRELGVGSSDVVSPIPIDMPVRQANDQGRSQ